MMITGGGFIVNSGFTKILCEPEKPLPQFSGRVQVPWMKMKASTEDLPASLNLYLYKLNYPTCVYSEASILY